MKKLTYLLFSLSLLACSYLAKGQSGPAILGQKCLGGSRYDFANDVLMMPDGGYLVVGTSYSNDGDVSGHHGSLDSSDAWVCRLNPDLSIRWQRSMGGSGNDQFSSVALTQDGGIAIFGTSSSNDGDVTNNRGMTDFWLVRLDGDGKMLWNKLYGGNADETVYDGIPTSDGGFALIGYATSYNGADVVDVHGGYGSDVWIVKTNASGTLLWQKAYGNNGLFEYGTTIIEDEQKNLVAYVHSPENSPKIDFSLPANGYESLLMRVSGTNGAILAQTLLAGRFDQAGSVAKSPNGYIANVNASVSRPTCWDPTGFTGRFDAALNPIGTLITTPSNCSPTLSTTYWSPLALTHGTLALDDSTWLGVGALYSHKGPLPQSDTSNAIIVTGQFRQDGNLMQWSMYGGGRIDQFNSIRARPGSSEFMAVGLTYSNDGNVSGNHGDADAWVVRLGRANQVKGVVFIDRNGNGVRDAGEPNYDRAVISTTGGGRTISTLPVNGSYALSVDTGAYVTTIDLRSTFYTVQSPSLNASFQGFDHISQADFPVIPVPGKKDLSVSIVPIGLARPGSQITYDVRISNQGTDTLSGHLLSFIKDRRTTVSATSPLRDRVNGDTLDWDHVSLPPGVDSTIHITLLLGITPTLAFGDTLQITARVDGTSDLDPSNNSVTLRQPIRASFDPNEKTEVHAGLLSLPELQAGTNMQYRIDFQNTGNDTAFNVVVKDTLPATLNAATVDMISASHGYKLRILEGHILEWTFSNIMLPDSTTNEKASHGRIVYRIRPANGLTVGGEINNRASIYFDYALPVRTELSRTVVSIPGRAAMDIPGLQNSYCRKDTILFGKLRVLPAGGSTGLVQVRLDTMLIIPGVDSSVRYDIRTLPLGQHTLTTVFQDIYGKDSTIASFVILSDSLAKLSIGSSALQVSDTDPNIVITATATAGGGPTPKFEFWKNTPPLALLQGQSLRNTVSIDPKTLSPGVNWIQVTMYSSATCASNPTIIDSISVTKNTVTGLFDPDFPGSNITAYPNPVSGQLSVKGLSTLKTYSVQLYSNEGRLIRTEHVAGKSTISWAVDHVATGTYFLRIIDDKKNRTLGTIPLIKR